MEMAGQGGVRLPPIRHRPNRWMRFSQTIACLIRVSETEFAAWLAELDARYLLASTLRGLKTDGTS